MIREWSGIPVEVHENPTAPVADQDRWQPAVVEIEPVDVVRERGLRELALDIVGPAVIRAAEGLGATASVDDFGAPMAADVRERVEPAILAASDHDRLVDDVEREVVTGIGNLLDAADDQPLLEEDALGFTLENLGRGVHPAGHMARFRTRMGASRRQVLFDLGF